MSTATYPTYITAPSQTGEPKFTKYQVDFSIDKPIERLFLQSSSIEEAEECKVAVVKGLGGLLLPGPEASIGEQVTFSVTESQLEDIANEGHPTWEAFLKAIPFAEAADKCGFVTIDKYYVYITPPTTFEGEIKDKDITITKTEEGYKIGLCNNLWDSELDVFFDEVYQGTILKGPNWKYFTVDYKIDHVIVAGAAGTSDERRAWHRYLSEEDWPGTTPTSTPPDPNEYKPKIYLDKNEKWELSEVYYYGPLYPEF